MDIAVSREIKQFTVSNDSNDFDNIIAELRNNPVALILMEATGGLEAALACSLQAEGFDVAVVILNKLQDARQDRERGLLFVSSAG